jgi:hypothetical protein
MPRQHWLRPGDRRCGLFDERGHRCRLRHVDSVAAGHLDHSGAGPLGHEALELGGIKPPGDKCDPYVTVYITMLRPAKFVRRCTWKVQSLQPPEGQQLAEVVAPGAEAEWLLERLIRLGLVECQWVRVEQMDVLEAKKFVQGMCPPGTF